MSEFAYDFSIVPGPDPLVLARAGAAGMLGYSFGARQSDDYLARVRALGMTVVWIWERNTDSIFFADGVSECRLHERSAKPGELTYVACDTNDGGVAGRDLSPFLRDWAATTREAEFGLYGSSGAIRQGKAFGGKLTRFWGVVNWINGGFADNDPRNIAYWADAGAHLVQLIGSPIPNTDQNLILKPEWGTIGAPAPDPEEDVAKQENIFIRKQSDDGKPLDQQVGIFVADGIHPTWKRHVLPEEWKLANDLADYAQVPRPAVHPLGDQHWDSIPDCTPR